MFGARIRVGFCVFWMTWAIAKVLPEPVTPSSTWSRSPRSTASVSSAIAWGWSPAGTKSEASTMGALDRLSASGGAGMG